MLFNFKLESIPPLFCKPIKSNHTDEFLYRGDSSKLNAEISFRSLQLETDIDVIYDWVNRPYARRFWQLAESYSTLL